MHYITFIVVQHFISHYDKVSSGFCGDKFVLARWRYLLTKLGTRMVSKTLNGNNYHRSEQKMGHVEKLPFIKNPQFLSNPYETW